MADASAKAVYYSQDSLRIPYLLAACLYIYNQVYRTSTWSKDSYLQVFKFQAEVAKEIRTTFIDDLASAFESLELKSPNEFFWFNIGMLVVLHSAFTY